MDIKNINPTVIMSDALFGENSISAKAKILIVDDEKNVIKSLSRLLVDNGYSVDSAESGKDALSILDQGHFDIVLSDIAMPHMDGIELLKHIKTNHPDVDVIMITGNATINLAVESLLIGAYDFKQKPWNDEDILATIARLLEKRKLTQELIQAKRHNELILKTAAEGIIGIDKDGRHSFVNPAAAKILGYDIEELIGQSSHSMWHYSKPNGSPYPIHECPIAAAYKDGIECHMGEEMFLRKDGTSFPVSYSSTPILEDGVLLGSVIVFRDISEHKQTEELIKASIREKDQLLTELDKRIKELRTNYRNFHFILEKDCNGIIVTSRNGLIVYANPAAKKIFKHGDRELTGSEFGIPITVSDTEMTVDILLDNGEVGTGELFSIETEWEGESAYLIMIHDVTEQIKLQEEMRSLAFHDELTGLENRRAFTMLASQQLMLSDRAAIAQLKETIVLLFIDLDGMKYINDVFGHKQGDLALIATADVLRKTFRKTDLISRLGGDEFAVLAIEAGSDETLLREKLQSHVDSINEQKIYPFTLSLSMGAAWYDPAKPCAVEELLKIADESMYKDKLKRHAARGQ